MIALPPDRDRRNDKRERIQRGYTHLRVTRATARLVVELATALDAISLDEALFYIAVHHLGVPRCQAVFSAAPRPAVTRAIVARPPGAPRA